MFLKTSIAVRNPIPTLSGNGRDKSYLSHEKKA
jgi:hypothetical protein